MFAVSSLVRLASFESLLNGGTEQREPVQEVILCTRLRREAKVCVYVCVCVLHLARVLVFVCVCLT